jgi:hypothetical protein
MSESIEEVKYCYLRMSKTTARKLCKVFGLQSNKASCSQLCTAICTSFSVVEEEDAKPIPVVADAETPQQTTQKFVTENGCKNGEQLKIALAKLQTSDVAKYNKIVKFYNIVENRNLVNFGLSALESICF